MNLRLITLGLLFFIITLSAEEYKKGPESFVQKAVPQGKVQEFSHVSSIFGESTRKYWVYTPAGYDTSNDMPYMIFQDGERLMGKSWASTIVLDNLIHQKKIPPMIAIFINPGELKDASGTTIRWNRSKEYDSVDDSYARFLEEELLPEVKKTYKLTSDPNKIGITGSSSGGICAFVAAFHRPDLFRRVATFVGSYTNLRGGQDVASLIRKTESKPLKVYMQSGENDLDIYSGSWPIGNLDVAAALKFAGYNLKHVIGTEGHNNQHGRAILPEVLTWLWTDADKEIVANKSTTQPIMKVLTEEDDWELVSEGYKFTEGPAVDKEGNVYFTDLEGSKIYKIDCETWETTVFIEKSGGANGLIFGPDGLLYACQRNKKRVVAYDQNKKMTIIATNVRPNDVVVNHKGDVYFTAPGEKKIYFVPKGGEKQVAASGLKSPNGIILNAAQNLLMIAEYSGQYVVSFGIAEDGSLFGMEKFVSIQMPRLEPFVKMDGMAIDHESRLYVATNMGLQMCDRAGRVQGIIPAPQRKPLANVVFGGKNLDYLIITCTDKVYKRKTKVKGVRFYEKPLELKKPRL
ncbi:MAG: SMP-30/gluconolactonase/LRE family protein [Lentisphaeraceae bacterium]|nr:SMP-30/gluconolactonase/LRE family protein [Lentisphaeraceae bacterium]